MPPICRSPNTPPIRDLGRITLYRPGPRAAAEDQFPHAGPLMTRKANLDLVAEHWDDLLRLAGSLKFGHATASLLVGKLSASGRQNTLAAALEEYGRCGAPSTPRSTWPIRNTGARSPASSTRANPCTRCAGICSTPTRA
nr:Tn3 family transposase [Nocardia cyriacigeorgica]